MRERGDAGQERIEVFKEKRRQILIDVGSHGDWSRDWLYSLINERVIGLNALLYLGARIKDELFFLLLTWALTLIATDI